MWCIKPSVAQLVTQKTHGWKIECSNLTTSRFTSNGKEVLKDVSLSPDPSRDSLIMQKTPICQWHGCPAVGQNLDTYVLHYITDILPNMTLKYNKQTNLVYRTLA